MNDLYGIKHELLQMIEKEIKELYYKEIGFIIGIFGAILIVMSFLMGIFSDKVYFSNFGLSLAFFIVSIIVLLVYAMIIYKINNKIRMYNFCFDYINLFTGDDGLPYHYK